MNVLGTGSTRVIVVAGYEEEELTDQDGFEMVEVAVDEDLGVDLPRLVDCLTIVQQRC